MYNAERFQMTNRTCVMSVKRSWSWTFLNWWSGIALGVVFWYRSVCKTLITLKQKCTWDKAMKKRFAFEYEFSLNLIPKVYACVCKDGMNTHRGTMRLHWCHDKLILYRDRIVVFRKSRILHIIRVHYKTTVVDALTPRNLKEGFVLHVILVSHMAGRYYIFCFSGSVNNSPVSQYECPCTVALASSACVNKITKIITEFTRKDLFFTSETSELSTAKGYYEVNRSVLHANC